jgi:hypothetical protein
MNITDNNGYLVYHIEDGEIIIDDIKSFIPKIGTGKKLINLLKDVSIDLGLPISLASYPQDDTISQSELNLFYLSLNFQDMGGDIFTWKC